MIDWVNRQERRLIEALRRGGWSGVGDGLIGSVAGTRVKILPSTIYCNGLQRFAILRASGTIEQVSGNARRTGTAEEALTELVGTG